MQKDVRRRFDIMEAALRWSEKEPPTDPGHLAVLERLRGTIMAGDVLALQQIGATNGDLAATRRRNRLRRRIHHVYLHHMVRVARLAEREVGITGIITRLPRTNIAHDIFLVEARVMLDQARDHRELLEANGLGERFVEELEVLVADYGDLQSEINTERMHHVAARASLRALAADGMALMGVLDGLVEAQFRDQPAALASWKSVYRPMGYGVRHRKEAAA